MAAPSSTAPINAAVVDLKTGLLTQVWRAWLQNPNAPLGGIQQLTGSVTATGPGIVAATITDHSVTYAKIQTVTASRLLGRGSASGTGTVEELTAGTGLQINGTVLQATGGGGSGVPGLDGDEGPMGPPGVPGPVGATGATGPAGASGQSLIGPPGLDGEDGEAGLLGPMGLTGATGATGAAGASGQSLIGPPGLDGDEGEPGPPGPLGLTGATGATGSTGAAGPAGASILSVPFPLDGADGDMGYMPGPAGPAGAAGASYGTVPLSGWTVRNSLLWNNYIAPVSIGAQVVDNAALNLRLLTQSLGGAATYTAIATIRGGISATNSTTFGLYVYDGTKAYGIEVLNQTTASGGINRLRVQRFTNVTTASTTSAGPTIGIVGYPITLKITQDVTNRTYYYYENNAFTQFFQEAANTFLTETDVGFGGICQIGAIGAAVFLELLQWSLV